MQHAGVGAAIMQFNHNQNQAGIENGLVSIIILTCNQLHYTRQCIESIFNHTRSAFELVVVDNGSTDGTVDYLSALSDEDSCCRRIKVIRNKENAGFAKGNNQGIAQARGDYLLLLNNDVVVTSDWLSLLLGALHRYPEIGIVGPMSNYVSGPQLVKNPEYNVNTLEGLERFAAAWSGRNTGQVQSCMRIVGFCMLMRRSVIQAIGGMDTRFGLGNFEDDDFCLRTRLIGQIGAIARECYIHHFGGKTFTGNNLHYQERMAQNWKLFKQKWNIPADTAMELGYRVPVETLKFDPAEHFVPLDESPSEATPAGPDVHGAGEGSTLQEYCHGLNGHGRWQWLHRLTEENRTPPYMAVLDDVLIIGPLLIHHHAGGRLHALDMEHNRVSGGFGGNADGHGAEKFLSECGPMRTGRFMMLCDLRSDNFWHWTMEALSKVVMARACGFDGYYIVPSKFNLSGYIRESLELIGVSPDRICVYDGQPWRVEQLYLPQAIQGSHQLTEFPVVIDELRRMLMQPCTPIRHSFDRIYIARDDPKLNRRIVNETELLSLLFKYGFQRVVMEHFSLREQIAIASGANFLIAPHGAGAVHSMFMPGRSTFVELFPTTYVNPCMLPVIDRLKHRYFMVPSSHLGVVDNDNYEAPIYYLDVILKREIESGSKDPKQR